MGRRERNQMCIRDRYMLQLSHTTNLPLSYKIYHASQSVLDGLTGKVDKFYYDDQNPISGSQLTDTHAITFGSYDRVQYNAEPVYWQADDAREIKRGQTQYYVLEVNWEQSALSDAVKRSLYKEKMCIRDRTPTATIRCRARTLPCSWASPGIQPDTCLLYTSRCV